MLQASATFWISQLDARTAHAAGTQVDEEADYDDDDDRAPPPATPPSVAVGIHLGSMLLGDAGGLADFANRAGLGRYPRFASLIEPSLGIALDRIVIPIRARFASASSGLGLSTEAAGGGAGVGYLLFSGPSLVAFPSFGFGVARTRLSAGTATDSSASSTFESLAGSQGPAVLSAVSVTAEAAFDLQLRIVGTSSEPRGLYLGGRLGAVAPVGQTDWTLEDAADEARFATGPSPGVGGAFVSLSLSARY